MAVTFRGSIVTPMFESAAVLNGTNVVFAAVNTYKSRVRLNILRSVVQLDVVQFATGATANRVMPIMRTRRCNAADVSGGVELRRKVPWDTTQSSDAGVRFFYNPGLFGDVDAQLVATNPGDRVWSQYTNRQASAVKQQISWDNFVIPAMATTKVFALYPGEALILEQVSAIPTGGVPFVQIAWEEDEIDAGYTVGGTVRQGGFPVWGAKVFLLTDQNRDMPNPDLEVFTTDPTGSFSKQVSSNVKASVFVQHRVGEDLATDQGKPFIGPP